MVYLLPTTAARCDGAELPGRSYPITYHYRPANRQQPLVPQWGSVIIDAISNEQGSLLVFLPGAGEIDRLRHGCSRTYLTRLRCCVYTAGYRLRNSSGRSCRIAAGQRKVVLATNVAETSLTIEGIQVVIDSGLERRSSTI